MMRMVEEINRGADSAIRTYKNLREKYYGRDAYAFGEGSLNLAAFRLGREQRYAEALAAARHRSGPVT